MATNYENYGGYPLAPEGATCTARWTSNTAWYLPAASGVLHYAHNKILKIESKDSISWKVTGTETKWAKPPL